MTKQEFKQFNKYLINRGAYIEHPVLGRLVRNVVFDDAGNVASFQAVRDYGDYQLFVDVYPNPLRTSAHIRFNGELTISPCVAESLAEEARALCDKILDLLIEFEGLVKKGIL